MAIPPKYRAESEAVASYDWIDLQDGTGNVVYYLAHTTDSVGTDYILTRLTPYSSVIETFYLINAGEQFTDGARFDIDYDLNFNVAQVVKGKVIIQVGIVSKGRAAEDSSGYYIFELYHVDALGKETSIGTTQTETYTKSAAATTYHVTHAFINVGTDVHFAEDETLRLAVRLYTEGSGSGSVGDITYGHDPQNRDGTIITPSSQDVITNSYIVIPYKTEI